MTSSKPEIVLLQLGDELQVTLYEDMYTDMHTQLASLYNITRFRNAQAALAHLSQVENPPQAILIADGGFSKDRSRIQALQSRVGDYAKAGGTVVLALLFSSFVRPPNFTLMARKMGLGWETGDYHRTTFALNPAAQAVFGDQMFDTLEEAYSMKALHLKNVPAVAKVYIPTSDSRVESNVFAPSPVDQTQCPVAFERLGQGLVGYVGDVNSEVESKKVVLAMLGTGTVSA